MELSKRKSPIPTDSGGPEASGQVYAIVPAHGGSNADSVAGQLSRELSESYRLSVLLADFCAHGFPLWGSPDAPQRLDGRTWGAFLRRGAAQERFASRREDPAAAAAGSGSDFTGLFVRSQGEVFDTLEAREAHPRNIRRVLDYARSRYRITCADLSEARESSALEVLRHSDSIFLITNSDRSSIDLARHRAAWLRSMDLEDRSALILNRVAAGVGGAEAEDRTGLPVCAVVSDGQDLYRLAGWLAAPFLPRRSGPIPIRRVG